MDRIFTPENLASLFQAIDREELDLILVGGQAINIWASYYASRVPALAEYLPFSSEDLDFYGGKVEAIACQKILGGTINLNRDFDKYRSPTIPIFIFIECSQLTDRMSIYYQRSSQINPIGSTAIECFESSSERTSQSHYSVSI